MILSNVFSIKSNSPSTENEINFAENNIIGEIPEVYKQFLRESNGMVLNLCVLYDTNSIVEIYKVNEFEKYAPKYLSIGNDNGDRELVIKAEKDAYLCSFLDASEIGISEPDEWFDFVSWIDNGCKMIEEKSAEYGNVSIINIPNDKLKFLMETKKVFALSISTSALLKEVNSLPFIIVRGIHIGKAKKLINRTTFPKCYKFFGE